MSGITSGIRDRNMSGSKDEEKDKSEDRTSGKEKGKKEISLPICTRENINFKLECITCKEKGKKRIYFGESSRSSHQRGVENLREILSIVHYVEAHEGIRQDFLMKVTDHH